MTGHGAARRESPGLSVGVEVRAVNNRYLKVVVRAGEGNILLEPRIEEMVRQKLQRGTVQVNIRIQQQRRPDDFRLNIEVLRSYRKQLESLCDKLHAAETIHVESLLVLPGIVDEGPAAAADTDGNWPLVQETVAEALSMLLQMREDEGAAMKKDLTANCRAIAVELDAIETRAPEVVSAYRRRITEKVEALLAEFERPLDPADVIREVAFFAERSDISEEIVRLKSHLEQFSGCLETDASGRKLEFLLQEMFREANTIGSKANDAEIAARVVDIKAAIERLREMVQNVE